MSDVLGPTLLHTLRWLPTGWVGGVNAAAAVGLCTTQDSVLSDEVCAVAALSLRASVTAKQTCFKVLLALRTLHSASGPNETTAQGT